MHDEKVRRVTANFERRWLFVRVEIYEMNFVVNLVTNGMWPAVLSRHEGIDYAKQEEALPRICIPSR
jgi:hypothetical protein